LALPRFIAAVAVLWIAPLAASATPVEISLSGTALGCANVSCTRVARYAVSGTLSGELGADLSLADLEGSLTFTPLRRGAPLTQSVTGGEIDADGGSLLLGDGRTLNLPRRTTRFDGTDLSVAGTTRTRAHRRKNVSVRLTGTLRPIVAAPVPEPVSTLLLAAGGILVGTAIRRKI
jgi:hypothetical protein